MSSGSKQFSPPHPVVIGILGGIAAGKSTVAREFASRGLAHVDADQIARRVVGDPETLAALREAFGPGVLTAEGQLDRPAMARIAFGDDAARARLEAITHPRIRAGIDAELAAAVDRGQSALLDAPLLLEGGLIDRCDVCVFVEAAENVREERARARGWEPGELARREAAQAPLDHKRRRAAFLVRTDTPWPETERAIASMLARLEGTARSPTDC